MTLKSRGPLACFESRVGILDEVLGPPVARDLDSNGLGPCDAYTFAFECGLEIGFYRFHVAGDGHDHEAFGELSPCEIHSSDGDLAHARFHLGLAPEDLSLFEPLPAQPAPHFAVFRQDDNGKEFVVATVTSRCEGEYLVRDYEARGHKQVYWIAERVPDAAHSG